MKARAINTIIPAHLTRDGHGVRIFRSIGSDMMSHLDPFLLLDELRSDEPDDYIGGFPDHPHRGFETVTYMLEGQMRHKDSEGNEGVIRPGDLQWMSAGSGIIHSEMPEQSEGRLWGFQFWINLPAKQKMCEPRYQEIAASQIPSYLSQGVVIKVLAGEMCDEVGRVYRGPIKDIATQPLMLDVHLRAAKQSIPLPSGHQALVYIYRGNACIGGKEIPEQHLVVLDREGDLLLESPDELGALVLAAKPIGEPIARLGPFVMNTDEEIKQAFGDYRRGELVKRLP